jgi:diguanylate cyclase (GGDEF)-like protein
MHADVEAAPSFWSLRRGAREADAGRGLIEGDWVREPLWIALVQSALLSVALPLASGFHTIAGINSVTTALLSTAIYVGDPRRRSFRIALHVANASIVFSLYYAVFVAGFPGSMIIYYTPLVLLCSAHMLGASAAAFWSIPCLVLSIASEFVPAPTRVDPGPVSAILTEGGLVLTMLAFVVSLRRAYDRKSTQLERLATTDALTGLANRLELQLALRHALERSRRFGRHGALVFLDVDGLKRVNDEHGHDAGDELLREISERIRRLTRGIDVAARLGGDEFVVLLSEYDDPRGAEIFSRRLLDAARASYVVSGAAVDVGASIGLVEFPQLASSAELLLARADEAMYAAKRAGGGRIYRAAPDGVAEVP